MPDIAISIDSVIERKLDALAVIESQFLEGGAIGNASLLPRNAEERERRVAEVRTAHANRNIAVAHRFRDLVKEFYGEKAGSEVRYAEAFEICEYGRRPDKEELLRLFPFFFD
jgi:hypothetical protein